MNKFWSAIWVVIVVMLAHPQADAKRLGGGQSVGQSSGNVAQRQSHSTTAPNANTPAQNTPNTGTQSAAPTAMGNPASPIKTTAPPKPWGAMLGGLAAGLGLAWLAHSLGMGEAFGQVLVFLLLGVAAFIAFKMVMRLRQNQSPTTGQGGSFSFSPATAPTASGYSADKVGNDASARPWERNSISFDSMPLQAASGGGGMGGVSNWGIPAGFDTTGFIETAKRNFTTLQAAWDRSDVSTLRSMMTDTMLSEIRTQLAERETHRGTQPNQTDVVMLEAQLLGIEDLGEAYMASVEFSGMIREEASVGPSPFREVWNMTKPKSGASGWLVAGVQALQ